MSVFWGSLGLYADEHRLAVMATSHRSLPVWPLKSDLSVRSYYPDYVVTRGIGWGQRAGAPLLPPSLRPPFSLHLC